MSPRRWPAAIREKVVLARADVMLSGGKHYGRPEYRAKFPWWTESQRLLDDFAAHDGRFDASRSPSPARR